LKPQPAGEAVILWGMKTAVSIPDDVFKGAERLARRTRKSRSQLFSDALREYVARHAADELTEAMDRVCTDVQTAKDEFVLRAATRVLEKVEWRLRKVKSDGRICPRLPLRTWIQKADRDCSRRCVES